MPKIEWQEDICYQPEHLSLEDFCKKRNIRLIGHDNSGLLVFVEKSALEAMIDFLNHDIKREHGGVLLGKPYYDANSNRLFTVISAILPALETEGSAVRLQFTSKSWEYISDIIRDEFPDLMIVGWHHSHPGLGVFMSETDRSTQKSFYFNDWNVAVVVDPIQQKTGWFAGADCIPLARTQVLVYEENKTSPDMINQAYPSVEETDKRQKNKEIYSVQKWQFKASNYLPIAGILGLVLFLLVWAVKRDRV